MNRNIFPPGRRIALFEQDVGRDDTPIFFTLKGCIGMGASSVAYEAVSDAGLPVVLKQLSPSEDRLAASDYAALEERFVSAHRRQRQFVNDPAMGNIVSALSGFYRDSYGVPWVSVKGTFSRAYSRIAGEKEAADSLALIKLLAEGVLAFHRAGYLLLDITPDNILFIQDLGISAVSFFDLDSFVSTADISRAIVEGQSLSLLSTTPYAAPELSDGLYGADLRSVNERCDIYSIGAVLYFALFSTPPRGSGLLSWKNSIPGKNYDLSRVNWSGGKAPEGACARKLREILQKTLCIDQAGRYESCEALVAALDELISIQSPRALSLRDNMPSPGASFVGRERELDTLSFFLNRGEDCIFISGMAGMGKTELAFRAAQKFGGCKFYYMPYASSLRESIAALPVENLPDSAREDTDARFSLICEHLSTLDRNTILLVDNFDAPDEAATASLISDRDFDLLRALPPRLIFTSRQRFPAFPTVELGALPAGDLSLLCRSLLPGEDTGNIDRLIALLQYHTLSVDIAARTLAQNRGKLSISALIANLGRSSVPSPSGPADSRQALALLLALFSSLSWDGTSRELLGLFCLVPSSGISSSLLNALLSADQWKAAMGLAKSGWLRHEPVTELWSVHPLLVQLYMGEKRVCPDRERFAPLTEKLRQLEKDRGSTLDALTRRQIDGIYANYMRRAHNRRKGRLAAVIALSAAFIAAAAGIALAAVLHWQELNLDPQQKQFDSAVLELVVGTYDELDEEEKAHDLAILNERLGLIAGDDSVDFTLREDGLYYASLPLDLFIRRGGDLEYVLENCLLHEGGFQFSSDPLGDYNYSYWSFDTVEGLNFEVSQEAVEYTDDYGSVTYLPQGDSHIRLTLSEERSAEFFEVLEREGTKFYYNGHSVPTAGEDQDESLFILVDPEISVEGVCHALISSFTGEKLSAEYDYDYRVSPEAIWEDPDAVERSGVWQRSRDALPENTVIAFFSAFNVEDLSDIEFENEKAKLRRRLDLLELDYAMGAATCDGKLITVALPADSLGEEYLPLICADSLRFSAARSRFFPEDAVIEVDRAEIISDGENPGLALKLSFTPGSNSDNYDWERYLTFLSHAEILRPEYIFLGSGEYNSAPLLSAAFDPAQAAEGVMVFDRLLCFDRDVISDEYRPLLRLIADAVNSPHTFMYSLDDWHFASDEGSFGFDESSADERRLRDFMEDYPDIELRFESGPNVRMFVPGTDDRDTMLAGFEFAEAFLKGFDFMASNYDSYYIEFGRGSYVMRLIISSSGIPYGLAEEDLTELELPYGYLSISGVCRSGRAEALFDDFVRLFRDKELYKLTGFEITGNPLENACTMYRLDGEYYSIIPLYSEKLDPS